MFEPQFILNLLSNFLIVLPPRRHTNQAGLAFVLRKERSITSRSGEHGSLNFQKHLSYPDHCEGHGQEEMVPSWGQLHPVSELLCGPGGRARSSSVQAQLVAFELIFEEVISALSSTTRLWIIGSMEGPSNT